MERNKMIEILMTKVNVSRDDAQEALEKCNWDILDAIIYLERKSKIGNNEVTTIIEVKGREEEGKWDYSKDNNETFGGIGDIIGRMFKFVGKVIKKGNEHYFEVRKESEKPVRIPLTISALLLIFISVPTLVLLVLGLFCGYKYSISGNDINYSGVNSVFEEVSKSADNIKKDFKKGYQR